MADEEDERRLVGARVHRKEDFRILTGQGCFIDDVQTPGMLHACFVRSPMAHARLTSVDIAEALAVDGVVAILDDRALVDDIAPLNFGAPMRGLVRPEYSALARGTVRYVGEPIAIVVARSRAIAEDAAALVVVELDALPAVASLPAALEPHATQLHTDVPGNVVYRNETSTAGVDAAFADAAHVVDFTFDQHRWAPMPMETRGGIADYDMSSRMLTYQAACQAPHLTRHAVATALRHPLQQVRVVARDVGGSFGVKWMPTREEIVLCAAARRIGSSVKWIEDRNEHLVAGGHARDELLAVEVALDDDGAIRAIRADLTVNVGAYPGLMYVPSVSLLMRLMLPGPYRVPEYSCVERVVTTNTAPWVALRGPWAGETLVRERMLDHAARAIGISAVEIRRRNLLSLEDQPFRSPAGHTLDGVTAENTFRRAVELADHDRTLDELRAARADGRVVGFGIATFIEPAPGTPELWAHRGSPLPGEQMRARVEPDGRLTLHTVQMPHGQSHETTLAQVAADEFGVRFEDVRVVYGDTQDTPFSLIGTGGSRAATMATGSTLLATRAVKNKVLAIAAELLEADVRDLRIHDGVVGVRGTSGPGLPVADIAMGCYAAPHTMPDGCDLSLDATEFYDGELGGFAQATHCCWVEIDPDTGLVEIRRYLAVDDCGKMINPAVVEGQIRGAIAMGIGGMLLEEIGYDEDGNCLSGTFLDYLLPTAADLPDFELHHLEFVSEKLVNSRGVGEGGTIVAPAALLNAIEDAVLAAGGSAVTRSPVTPSRILELLGRIPGS